MVDIFMILDLHFKVYTLAALRPVINLCIMLGGSIYMLLLTAEIQAHLEGPAIHSPYNDRDNFCCLSICWLLDTDPSLFDQRTWEVDAWHE
jgi:hypothetical protein